jgi:Domain of unknown function (DUF2431)
MRTSKLTQCINCLRTCNDLSLQLVHGVDATKLEKSIHPQQLFDRIVFNFPHTGEQRVHLNR